MNQRLSYLQQKTLRLTTSPGVYIMKNSTGEIIYIGKAKNLKNRVSSYFRNNPDHTPKVAKMVENVFDYDFIVTDSEYEALLLECSLIKQHKPKYNILLKDDKGYHYIKISDEPFPRITSEKKNDGNGMYIGPFISSYVATQTVKEVNKVFKLPTCKNRFSQKPKKTRPCLNFHINQCIGVCNGNVSCEEYKGIVEQAVEYIKNGSESSVRTLELQMQKAAENLEFERAARIRDRIKAISKSNETQKIIDVNLNSCDIVASVKSPVGSCISVLMYRDGKLYDKTSYFFNESEYEENIMETFVLQYYIGRNDVPKTIYFDGEFYGYDMVNQALNSSIEEGNIKFVFPKRGNMLKYVMMAKSNAEEYLSIKNNRTGKEILALDELGEILGLKKPPMYIEAYDISNFSSSSMVAGMIVFENGRPLKKAYKRFSIKESVIQNDYACMQEVLKRRFNEYLKGEDEGFSKLPDLIFLDGGQGHVNAVKSAVSEYNLDVPIFGLVKDDKHRTRAISTEGGEIQVSRTNPAFILMTKIQDEVHRFSISYMKSKHTKNSLNFELTKVKGIGVKKSQKLMLKYKTIANLKNASPQELSESAGVSMDVAKELYEFIQNQLM